MSQSYKIYGLLITCSVLLSSCSSPLIKTTPELISDTSQFTITCDANKGNKGLLNFSGPVYIHLGLITDSSIHPNEWRYVKFKWGSTEDSALATPAGKNKWTYTIPNIRKFFGVSKAEKVMRLAVLFREGNCIDTNCRVLRNEDKSDLQIPLSEDQQ
jgi:hypothetical protein